jgi:hypothetical protein
VVSVDAGTVQAMASQAFRPTSLSELVAERGCSLKVSHPDGLNVELAI